MARLPEGDWVAANLPEIAARLVNSLPGQSAPAVQPPAPRRRPATDLPFLDRIKAALGTKSPASAWLVWIALAVALFVGVMALQGNNNFESAPGDGSSIQRDK